MSIITRQAYEIVYTGQDERLQPLYPKVVSSKSNADAEARRLKFSDRYQVSDMDIHVIAVKQGFVKDSFTRRFAASMKEQVRTNEVASGLVILGAFIILIAVLVSGIISLLGADGGIGAELVLGFGIVPVALGLFGWLLGAVLDVEPRQDIPLR